MLTLSDIDVLFDSEACWLLEILVLASVLALSDSEKRNSLKLVLALSFSLSEVDF